MKSYAAPLILAALAVPAACGGAGGTQASGAVDAGAPGASTDAASGAPVDAGAPDASDADASAPDASAPDAASAAATIRVHYPAAGHALAIRGSGGGLGWSQGAPASGAGDTFTLTLPALSGPIEYKPLLDDATWSLGPNYRVSPGQTVDVYPHFSTAKGEVTTLFASFHSATLNDDRAIYAYLPPSYHENTSATFPVVYMHDGQNLWAAMPQLAAYGTWNVDTAFDAAAGTGVCSANGVTGWGAQPFGAAPTTCTGDHDCASGECRTFPEAIVIGVPSNAQRDYELTPTTDPDNPGGGGADLYLKMLVTELKPAVDAALRTRPDAASTALAGSSLGGLCTAYAGTRYPAVFGRLGVMSPSTWWNGDVILADVQATANAPVRPLTVYIDSAQGDAADGETDTDKLAAAYLALGYVDGVTFRHVVQPNAQHDETYWAQRFPGAMQLLLGAR